MGARTLELPLGLMLNSIDVFLLVFVRVSGLFVIAPIFGRRNVPTYFKIGFSFMLALILINVVKMPNLDYYNNIYRYSLLVFKEFLVGLTIGYVSYLVFTAIYLAGQLIDMQIGFSMVSVLDPLSNIQIPITSNLYFILCMLIFLMANGHHVLIRALFESFAILPPGTAIFGTNLMNDILRVFSDIFLLAFKISAPIIAAILATDVALGVISRAVPQMNVFVLGMPLKIIIGLVVIIITIPVFGSLIKGMIESMNTEMFNLMKNMAK
jgi:flagellar biosynthetic protein FliR